MTVWSNEEIKTCINCNGDFKVVIEYWNTPRSRVCRSCKRLALRAASKKHRENNKVKLAKKIRIWRLNNKEKVILNKQQYRRRNPDKIKTERQKHYSQECNKKKKKAQDRSYYLANKESIRKRQYAWTKRNAVAWLRNKVSHLIREHLKRFNANKGGKSAFKYLDYTPQELVLHMERQFEPWMNWSNNGLYIKSEWVDDNPVTWKWQIDHIIPQSKLPYDSMEHPNFKLCWALSNLRPLSAKENVLKGNRYETSDSRVSR